MRTIRVCEGGYTGPFLALPERYGARSATLAIRHCGRVAGIALLAAAVTFGLYQGMRFLIQGEDFMPSDIQEYELTILTPQEDDEPDRPDRPKPDLIDTVDLPPPPPALSGTVETPEMGLISFSGVLPGNPVADTVLLRPDGVNVVRDRKIQPLTPPVPVYPHRALTDQIEGDCDVIFDVSPRGEPLNIRANCTHPVFVKAARKAVQKAQFAPQIENNRPILFKDALYPLQFRLTQ